MTNIVARMYVRNIHPSAIEKKSRFRPMSQTFAATRDLGGICMIGHRFFWDHAAAHLPHGRNLAHSQARCFVIMHLFPGEAWLRTTIGVFVSAWNGSLHRRLSRNRAA